MGILRVFSTFIDLLVKLLGKVVPTYMRTLIRIEYFGYHLELEEKSLIN